MELEPMTLACLCFFGLGAGAVAAFAFIRWLGRERGEVVQPGQVVQHNEWEPWGMTDGTPREEPDTHAQRWAKIDAAWNAERDAKKVDEW